MTIFTEPTIELVFLLFKACKQFKDRGYSNDYKKTNTVQLFEWVDLYKGTEFNIDIRYA